MNIAKRLFLAVNQSACLIFTGRNDLIHKLDAKAAQNASEGFRDETEIMRNQVATDTDTVSNALDSVNAQMVTFEEDSSSLLSSMLQISTDLTHTQDLMVTKYPLY